MRTLHRIQWTYAGARRNQLPAATKIARAAHLPSSSLQRPPTVALPMFLQRGGCVGQQWARCSLALTSLRCGAQELVVDVTALQRRPGARGPDAGHRGGRSRQPGGARFGSTGATGAGGGPCKGRARRRGDDGAADAGLDGDRGPESGFEGLPAKRTRLESASTHRGDGPPQGAAAAPDAVPSTEDPWAVALLSGQSVGSPAWARPPPQSLPPQSQAASRESSAGNRGQGSRSGQLPGPSSSSLLGALRRAGGTSSGPSALASNATVTLTTSVEEARSKGDDGARVGPRVGGGGGAGGASRWATYLE